MTIGVPSAQSVVGYNASVIDSNGVHFAITSIPGVGNNNESDSDAALQSIIDTFTTAGWTVYGRKDWGGSSAEVTATS